MPFAAYEELLAPGSAHISTMPNTPIAAQAGVMVGEERHSLSDGQVDAARGLFAGCALLVFVSSEQLAIAGRISGCGPAFACMMVEALADAGVKHGLQRSQAYQLAGRQEGGQAPAAADGRTSRRAEGRRPFAERHHDQRRGSPGGKRHAACADGGSRRSAVINSAYIQQKTVPYRSEEHCLLFHSV
ncbi:MAG: pyrroline-5-carboxylate reductase dimerization domain-containing protein [Merdibacter sp.]